MRRGDVVLVDLDPARAGESNKRRPCILVSNDGAHRAAERSGHGVVAVVPLTSNVTTVHSDFQVLIDDVDELRMMGLAVPSKAQCEQIRSIAVDRVVSVIGRCAAASLGAVDEGLRFHLSL